MLKFKNVVERNKNWN